MAGSEVGDVSDVDGAVVVVAGVLSVVTPATVGSEISPSWLPALEQALPTSALIVQIAIARQDRDEVMKRATALFNHSAIGRLFLSVFPVILLAYGRG